MDDASPSRLYPRGTYLCVVSQDDLETLVLCQTCTVVTSHSITIPVIWLKESMVAGLFRPSFEAFIPTTSIVEEVMVVKREKGIVEVDRSQNPKFLGGKYKKGKDETTGFKENIFSKSAEDEQDPVQDKESTVLPYSNHVSTSVEKRIVEKAKGKGQRFSNRRKSLECRQLELLRQKTFPKEETAKKTVSKREFLRMFSLEKQVI